MKKTWKDVDWVELGCRGWEIDETGVRLYDPPGNEWASVNYAHIDFASLRLAIDGSPEWTRRVSNDLWAANVLSTGLNRGRRSGPSFWSHTVGTDGGKR